MGQKYKLYHHQNKVEIIRRTLSIIQNIIRERGAISINIFPNLLRVSAFAARKEHEQTRITLSACTSYDHSDK